MEAGEEVVISRRGQPVARMVQERGAAAGSSDRVERLRGFHAGEAALSGSAVDLVRELRDQQR